MRAFSSADGTQRCERRGCSKRFAPQKHVPQKGPTRKRFCSKSCRHMEGQYRRGVHRRIPVGECRNGHLLGPDNTREVVRGGYMVRECRECARAMEKNPKRLAYKREWEQRNRAHRLAQKHARRAALKAAAA